jgi:hypothetical protein
LPPRFWIFQLLYVIPRVSGAAGCNRFSPSLLCARSGDSFLLRSLLLARIESPVLLVVNSRRKSCLSALLSASVLEAAAGFSLCVQISIRGSSSSADLILRAGVSDRIAQASICFASQSLCASFMSSPTVALAPRSAPPAVFVQFFRTTSGAGCFWCPSLPPGTTVPFSSRGFCLPAAGQGRCPLKPVRQLRFFSSCCAQQQKYLLRFSVLSVLLRQNRCSYVHSGYLCSARCINC